MTRADILRARLADVGARRTAAAQAKATASRELAGLVPSAIEAGLSPTEVAELTGLSRQAVYDFARDRGRAAG